MVDRSRGEGPEPDDDLSAGCRQQLFERESRVLGSLDHPSIPRFFDSFAGQIDGQHTFVLVQQYIDAPSLRDKVASGWRATEAEKELIGKPPAAAAFQAAGAAAVRSAKPQKDNAFKVELTRRTVTRALEELGSFT